MNNIEIKHSEIVAGGFNTSYIEAGSVENSTIVLVHDGSFGTTAELCWGPVMKDLAQEFHVVAPDLLGWGGTDKVVFLDRSPYSFRMAHLSAWCEAVGVREAHFVGVSFGGSLILRALSDPSTSLPTLSAISISGTGGPCRLQSGIEALGNYEPSMEAAERLTSLIVGSLDGLEEHVKERYENSLIPGHWEALSAPKLRNPAASGSRPQDTFLDSLKDVNVPVLLLEGKQDVLLEPGWAAILSEKLPFGSSKVLDSAHEPNIDQPAMVAELIRDHIGNLG